MPEQLHGIARRLIDELIVLVVDVLAQQLLAHRDHARQVLVFLPAGDVPAGHAQLQDLIGTDFLVPAIDVELASRCRVITAAQIGEHVRGDESA